MPCEFIKSKYVSGAWNECWFGCVISFGRRDVGFVIHTNMVRVCLFWWHWAYFYPRKNNA